MSCAFLTKEECVCEEPHSPGECPLTKNYSCCKFYKPPTNIRKFQVGTKVLVRDNYGQYFKGYILNINDYREPSKRYAVEIYEDDLVFVGIDRLKLDEGAE